MPGELSQANPLEWPGYNVDLDPASFPSYLSDENFLFKKRLVDPTCYQVMPFSPQLIYNYTFLCCTLVFRDFFCKRFSKKSFIGDENFTFFSYCVLLRELANVLQVTLHLALLAGAKISVEHWPLKTEIPTLNINIEILTTNNKPDFLHVGFVHDNCWLATNTMRVYGYLYFPWQPTLRFFIFPSAFLASFLHNRWNIFDNAFVSLWRKALHTSTKRGNWLIIQCLIWTIFYSISRWPTHPLLWERKQLKLNHSHSLTTVT